MDLQRDDVWVDEDTCADDPAHHDHRRVEQTELAREMRASVRFALGIHESQGVRWVGAVLSQRIQRMRREHRVCSVLSVLKSAARYTKSARRLSVALLL